MKFTYKAQNSEGKLYEGERTASDKFALARDLRAEGETLVYARGEGTKHSFSLKSFSFYRISIHDKIIFTRNLSGMLKAGLPLSRALSVLERQTGNEKLKKIISSVNTSIGTGSSFSVSLAMFPSIFPTLVTSMVKAGEEGGKMGEALGGIADQLERTYLLQRKVRGALMYPAVVITVMLIIGILMFIFIVPQLTSTFTDFGVELPFSTRVVVATSNFMRDHTITGLALILVVLFAIFTAVKTVKGKRIIDFILLRIPIISTLVKEANAARTGQTLSSLLSSGVEVVTALQITSEVMGNSYYRDVLEKARETIQKGEPISAIFREASHVYPPFLSEMVAVGEETGKLSEMLRETGVFFENEVEQKTKDMSTIIEPVLMVIVGVAVFFFAVAMLSPAYSLMDSI